MSAVAAAASGDVRDLCGVYVGTLRHRRHRPVPHDFTYPTFMVLLDIDRLPELMRVSRLTSYNRWNWAAYDERDHFGHPDLSLRERLVSDARRQGIHLTDGPILMLTHLRYLGYCFNPVSFFYCFDRAGVLVRVMAEVRNTFGGAHNYWLDVAGRSGSVRASAPKSLYVSPFMPVELDYTFAFTPPGERLVAQINVYEPPADETHRSRSERLGGAAARLVRPALFDATLSLARRPWAAAEIRAVLRRHPIETVKVIAAIHWQAWRLWWKGVPVHPRPTPTGIGVRVEAGVPHGSMTAGER